MAIKEFWTNVRSAVGPMIPHATVDSPRLDRERIESVLGQSTFWLTPGTIKGYEPGDLDLLNDEERDRLEEGVAEFKEVAKTVPKMASLTQGPSGSVVIIDLKIVDDARMERAITGFRKILEVLRPDKYSDAEAFVIGKTIENLILDEMPDWVREMVFEAGDDSSGAPALWIWVEVEDDAAHEASMFDNFMIFRDVLIAAGSEICPERWVYVRMRTVSEQRPATRTISQ